MKIRTPSAASAAPVPALPPPPPPPPALPPPAVADGAPPPSTPPPPRTGEVLDRAPELGRPSPSADPSEGVVRLPQEVRPNPDQLHAMRGILQGIADGGMPLGPLVLPPRTPPEAGGKGKDKGKGKPAPAAAPAPSGATTTTAATTAAPTSATRAWPSGPLIGQDLFAPDEVRRIIEGILTDDEIMAHPTAPGLTRVRLREVAKRAGFEPNRFGRFSAPLLVWFARAGVTVLEDDKANTAWARPRPVVGNDRVEIRRLLAEADPPDGDEVAIARAAGLDSPAL